MKQLHLAAAFAAAFIAIPSLATEGVKPIIVTATKTEIPLRLAGSSVSVLTADDIRASGDAFAGDALRSVPGVSVSQNGGPGGLSSVRIRGEEAYRTLVLIDGIEIGDPVGPQVATNFAPILSSGIDRIEIVRGPQSLLFGADAIGGVVQIFTARPEKGLAIEGEVSAGSFGTRGAALSLLHGTDQTALGLHGAFRAADGFSAKSGDPDLGDDDGYETYNLHGRGELILTPTTSLTLVARYVKSNAEFDGASAFPPFFPADPDRRLKTEEAAARAALTFSLSEPALKNEISAAYHEIGRDDLSNGLPFAFGPRFEGERLALGYLGTLNIREETTLLFGLDYERIDASSDGFAEDDETYAAYGEWQGRFGDAVFLTAGLRYDDNDKAGGAVSGRATGAYIANLIGTAETKFQASLGTGFRNPSPFEQATNAAAALPRLKEETSFGFDGGITQFTPSGDGYLGLAFFRQEISDEIRFDNVSFTGYFQAEGRSRSEGFEATMGHIFRLDGRFIRALTVNAAYTFTDSEVNSPDAEDGRPRVRRPAHVFSGSFALDAGRLGAVLSARTAADAEDGFREFRTPLDDYGLIDLGFSFDLTDRLEAFVSAMNVFDEQYEEVDGFNAPDAALYAGLRLRR